MARGMRSPPQAPSRRSERLLNCASILLENSLPSHAQRVGSSAGSSGPIACRTCGAPLSASTTRLVHKRLRPWRRGGVRASRRPAGVLVRSCSLCGLSQWQPGAQRRAPKSSASALSDDARCAHESTSCGRHSRQDRRRRKRHKHSKDSHSHTLVLLPDNGAMDEKIAQTNAGGVLVPPSLHDGVADSVDKHSELPTSSTALSIESEDSHRARYAVDEVDVLSIPSVSENEQVASLCKVGARGAEMSVELETKKEGGEVDNDVSRDADTKLREATFENTNVVDDAPYGMNETAQIATDAYGPSHVSPVVHIEERGKFQQQSKKNEESQHAQAEMRGDDSISNKDNHLPDVVDGMHEAARDATEASDPGTLFGGARKTLHRAFDVEEAPANEHNSNRIVGMKRKRTEPILPLNAIATHSSRRRVHWLLNVAPQVTWYVNG